MQWVFAVCDSHVFTKITFESSRSVELVHAIIAPMYGFKLSIDGNSGILF